MHYKNSLFARLLRSYYFGGFRAFVSLRFTSLQIPNIIFSSPCGHRCVAADVENHGPIPATQTVTEELRCFLAPASADLECEDDEPAAWGVEEVLGGRCGWLLLVCVVGGGGPASQSYNYLSRTSLLRKAANGSPWSIHLSHPIIRAKTSNCEA